MKNLETSPDTPTLGGRFVVRVATIRFVTLLPARECPFGPHQFSRIGYDKGGWRCAYPPYAIIGGYSFLPDYDNA
jgi:hypothetical protein